MSASNRTQVAIVRETTLGTTPGSPRTRAMRITGESLSFSPTYIDSDELRADRMLGDPIKTDQASGGGVNFELSYPDDNSPLSEVFRSAFFNPWTNTPVIFNDGVADSNITDAGTTANTYAVASGGAAFVVGMYVRATGFAQAANNQNFRVTSSTGTTVVGTALTLTAETAPLGTAKLKVVGFQGASGDIVASATGLTSTALNFTTLGLSVGQWIKLGGSLAANQFAITPANNDWVRVTAIAANALTFDNRPTGWGVDAGTGKTIVGFFGDTIKNGVTTSSLTIEKGFLGQVVPTYIVNNGMVVNTLDVAMSSKAKITGTAAFMGMGGGQSTTSIDAVPDPATTGQVMASNANVGRLAENGVALVSPNWAKDMSFQINNNLRALDALGSTAPVDIQPGECTVSGKINTYFGDNTLLAKFYTGTVTAINSRVAKNSQAVIFQFPHVTLRGGGNPQAQAKNQDVMSNYDFTASIDSAMNCSAACDRLEYFE